MFYYNVEYSITNRYDLNPLRVVGFVRCYSDEVKTEEFTQIPFSELNVNLNYQDVKADTKEGVTANVEAVVLPLMQQDNVQAKLQEDYEINQMGL